jgi:hypothetical protein
MTRKTLKKGGSRGVLEGNQHPSNNHTPLRVLPPKSKRPVSTFPEQKAKFDKALLQRRMLDERNKSFEDSVKSTSGPDHPLVPAPPDPPLVPASVTPADPASSTVVATAATADADHTHFIKLLRATTTPGMVNKSEFNMIDQDKDIEDRIEKNIEKIEKIAGIVDESLKTKILKNTKNIKQIINDGKLDLILHPIINFMTIINENNANNEN